MNHPIPMAALDDRLGFVGTAGSGKTYNAGSGVERILAGNGRVVIPDPLGVWWGLALNADGQRPAPWREKGRLVIFGGEHGDMPLTEQAGALIGETVASMGESAILDLSGIGTKKAEVHFMLAFLTSLYRHANVEPVHLIFDEADMWAPQTERDKGESPKLLGMMETIVRRGRVKGFIPWLISQRPAVLNKNVLSQVDGLVAFKLTASQDRKAIGDWVSGQADQGAWPAISASLPTLPTGTGIVWLPTRNVLETAAFPAKVTFDSSRTPTRGERVERKELKPLDLDKLKGKLASLEEEQKANDPRALKVEVARLTRELTLAQRAVPAAAWPDQRQEVEALRHDFERALGAAEDANQRLKEIGDIIGRPVDIVAVKPARRPAVPMKPAFDPACRLTEKPTRIIRDGYLEDGKTSAPAARSDGGGSVPSGCAKPLAALAGAYPAGMTEAQWSMVAGYKKTGGTWNEYRRRLMRAGMIEQRGNLWYATELGAEAAGPVELPPSPGPELVRWWAPKIQAPMHVVDKLIEVYPAGYTRAELADQIGMAVGGGSFQEYVRRLLRNSIAEERDGRVHLSDEVMGG